LLLTLHSNNEPPLRSEQIASMSKKDCKRFVVGAQSILDTIVSAESFIPESLFADGNESDDNNNDEVSAGFCLLFAVSFPSYTDFPLINPPRFSSLQVVPDANSSEALRFMKILAEIVESYVATNMSSIQSASFNAGTLEANLLTLAETLNGTLMELHTCGKDGVDCQNGVMTMCEAWWNAALVGKVRIINGGLDWLDWLVKI